MDYPVHLWQRNHMRYLSIIFAFCAAPVLAGGPMSGVEFETYSSGKTMFYAEGGQRYGVEQYLEGRRVRWSFLDGQCKEGYWYEDAAKICFVYEDNPDPQCWVFTETERGLSAQFGNDPDALALYEVQDAQEEMLCLGPQVGV